ncbi:hypothetical protein [uncultured Helicobacter sp.]|uniref:hypothetical protein n=1 Tax=uncultured Helicobacter sp. TaxID=175537 RepID=UPI002625B6A1|nr:hypothetical protein [uncultured Helicobacter sp.]
MYGIDKIREKLEREKELSLDLSYCFKDMLEWWDKHQNCPPHLQRILFMQFFLSILHKEDIECMGDFHFKSPIFVFSIRGIPKGIPLAYHYVIHETLSLLLGLNDIYYPYEQHKYLLLGKDSHLFSEWGMGAGEISLHSDDIYEELEVELLSLSIWKDTTKTPTLLLHPRELVKRLNDEDFLCLFESYAEFKSGKNVKVSKSQIKPLIFYKDDFGLGFNLDFRIDREVGDRMIGVDKKSQAFIDRFREMLKECETYAFGDEECFLVVVNKKTLHGRESLNGAGKVSDIARLSSVPRVLLRSKGVAQKCFESLSVGVAV